MDSRKRSNKRSMDGDKNCSKEIGCNGRKQIHKTCMDEPRFRPRDKCIPIVYRNIKRSNQEIGDMADTMRTVRAKMEVLTQTRSVARRLDIREAKQQKWMKWAFRQGAETFRACARELERRLE